MGNTEGKEEKETKDQNNSQVQKILSRFQLCSNKSGKPSQKKVKNEEVPPPKPPLRTHAERVDEVKKGQNIKEMDWVEIPLQVPETLSTRNQEKKSILTPIPPPRKHKMKLQEILEAPFKSNKLHGEPPQSPLPVIEPTIVPKKVVEHVCDGTHHHVRNVVNGMVVDEIIKSKEKITSQNTELPMNKKASTISLPSYEELKKKDDKRNKSPTKPKKKNSASSLEIDKKHISTSAAGKIESYMTRCKSFGSILPHQKTGKLKRPVLESDNDSEDSWDGLDDWDLGIIEHDVVTEINDAPTRPKTKQKNINVAGIKPDEKQNINHNLKKNNTEDQFIASYDKEIYKKPLKSKSLSSQDSGIQENIESSPPETYPFKKTTDKSVFESDAFFTSEFLKREIRCNDVPKPANMKLAPLATFDNDKEFDRVITSSSCIDYIKGQQNNDIKKTVAFADTADGIKSKEQSIIYSTSANESNSSKKPNAPSRKRSGIGHSNLLKFIKDSKSSNEDLKSNSVPQKTDLQDKNKESQLISEKTTLDNEEPKIIPEIKNLEASWQQLVKRDAAGNLSSSLELESSLSDPLETSSEDTKSTVETVSMKT